MPKTIKCASISAWLADHPDQRMVPGSDLAITWTMEVEARPALVVDEAPLREHDDAIAQAGEDAVREHDNVVK